MCVGVCGGVCREAEVKVEKNMENRGRLAIIYRKGTP